MKPEGSTQGLPTSDSGTSGRGDPGGGGRGEQAQSPAATPPGSPAQTCAYAAWVLLNNVQETPVGSTLEKLTGGSPAQPSLSVPFTALQRWCCSCFPLSEGPSLTVQRQ